MQIWKVILTTNNADATEESLYEAGAGAIFVTASGNRTHIEAYFQNQPDLKTILKKFEILKFMIESNGFLWIIYIYPCVCVVIKSLPPSYKN